MLSAGSWGEQSGGAGCLKSRIDASTHLLPLTSEWPPSLSAWLWLAPASGGSALRRDFRADNYLLVGMGGVRRRGWGKERGGSSPSVLALIVWAGRPRPSSNMPAHCPLAEKAAGGDGCPPPEIGGRAV